MGAYLWKSYSTSLMLYKKVRNRLGDRRTGNVVLKCVFCKIPVTVVYKREYEYWKLP